MEDARKIGIIGSCASREGQDPVPAEEVVLHVSAAVSSSTNAGQWRLFIGLPATITLTAGATEGRVVAKWSR